MYRMCIIAIFGFAGGLAAGSDEHTIAAVLVAATIGAVGLLASEENLMGRW